MNQKSISPEQAEILDRAASLLRAAHFQGGITATPAVAALIRARGAIAVLLEAEAVTQEEGKAPAISTSEAALMVAQDLIEGLEPTSPPGEDLHDIAARKLADHIADQRLSTIQGAFRLLGWKVTFEAESVE